MSSPYVDPETYPSLVLVRYGEIALKGNNRPFFERALAKNIKSACEDISKLKVELHRGRILVWPERRAERVARLLGELLANPAARMIRSRL